MKICSNCGKIVGNDIDMCPDCYGMAFQTEHGQEGQIWDLIMKLTMKKPAVGIAVMLGMAAVFALFIVVLANW